MDILFFWLALLTLLALLGFGLELAIGNRTIKFLKDAPRLVSLNPPRVTVVIAARNEADTIQDALQSVLQQNYENLEVLVVNDRSTDATGDLLAAMTEQYPQLQVVTVRELPQGWLGKNHALHTGARQASGKLLLFTDADVVMHPDAISKAVNYLLERRLDHLTCLPDMTTPSVPLQIFITTFGFFFSLYARPWRVRRPNNWHVGVGAFQLLRKEFYARIGGHIPIALRPDDDMKLGKLVKKNGGQQELLWGHQLLGVSWYHSLSELIQGLMKNSFAGVDYRFSLVLLSTVATVLVYLFPFVAVFLTHGTPRWLYVAAVVVLCLTLWDSARFLFLRRWYALGFPLATLLFLYILWRAALLTTFRRGIEWRGTRYSLKELRQNKV